VPAAKLNEKHRHKMSKFNDCDDLRVIKHINMRWLFWILSRSRLNYQ